MAEKDSGVTSDRPLRICTVPGCGRPHNARGLCMGHYRRARVGAPVTAPMKTWKRRPPNSELEYQPWYSMKARCRYPWAQSYEYYGGRGITVCERWDGPDGFNNFYADMGPRPSPEHQIDRIDNNGNYEPGNCRWATPKVQIRNRRNTRWLTFRGQSKPIATWAEEMGVNKRTLARRLREGWSAERIMSVPVRRAYEP